MTDKIDELMALAEMYADGVCTRGYFGGHRDALRKALEVALKPGCEPVEEMVAPNLYTAPPRREPLTDEQIAEITFGVYGSAIHQDDYTFARAIEDAHGITGGKE
jgi:hypothetical protein